jgi:hypothetical protein
VREADSRGVRNKGALTAGIEWPGMPAAATFATGLMQSYFAMLLRELHLHAVMKESWPSSRMILLTRMHTAPAIPGRPTRRSPSGLAP